MNWIQKKLQSFVKKKQTFKRERASRKDQDDSLWVNCGCNKMQLKEDLKKILTYVNVYTSF